MMHGQKNIKLMIWVFRECTCLGNGAVDRTTVIIHHLGTRWSVVLSFTPRLFALGYKAVLNTE